jgi:hypothetical protein
MISTTACGYCGLPAEEAETPLGIAWVHGEGTPDVPAVTSPGDFVTGNHRPGTRINPVDLVDDDDETPS